MLHYLLQPHRQTLPMFIMRPTKPPDSFSEFSTFAKMSMKFCRNTMLSTSSAMINIGYRTSFMLETRSGYIFKRIVLQGPIKISDHFSMGLTSSPRLWVETILSSTLHPSLDFTQCSMWTFFDHIFHHYWTPQRSQNKLHQQISTLTAWNKNPLIK
jgi:hypothetical protein